MHVVILITRVTFAVLNVTSSARCCHKKMKNRHNRHILNHTYPPQDGDGSKELCDACEFSTHLNCETCVEEAQKLSHCVCCYFDAIKYYFLPIIFSR